MIGTIQVITYFALLEYLRMPSANTKTVFPPFSSADLCAAKSVPAAYPLITVIFSFVSCREQSAAIPIPFADAFLEPQKPTAIPLEQVDIA